MKIKGTRLSKQTVALFAAAILLLSTGGFMGVKAAPQIQGSDYDAALELDTISVQVLENGKAVGENGLLTGIGTLKPGMTYPEDISVANDGTAPEYVRLVVRKYWTKGGQTVKDTNLTPALIELGLADGWIENTSEGTAEMSVYYCTKQLAAGDKSQAIKTVRVKGDVLTAKENITVSEKTVGKKTVYTYTYKYDGYAVNIEVEAQAVQTHNANDAIRSIWGVSDVTESGGTLTVK